MYELTCIDGERKYNIDDDWVALCQIKKIALDACVVSIGNNKQRGSCYWKY